MEMAVRFQLTETGDLRIDRSSIDNHLDDFKLDSKTIREACFQMCCTVAKNLLDNEQTQALIEAQMESQIALVISRLKPVIERNAQSMLTAAMQKRIEKLVSDAEITAVCQVIL